MIHALAATVQELPHAGPPVSLAYFVGGIACVVSFVASKVAR